MLTVRCINRSNCLKVQKSSAHLSFCLYRPHVLLIQRSLHSGRRGVTTQLKVPTLATSNSGNRLSYKSAGTTLIESQDSLCSPPHRLSSLVENMPNKTDSGYVRNATLNHINITGRIYLPNPPEVPEVPLPFLSDEELEEFVHPLYTHFWGIKYTDQPFRDYDGRRRIRTTAMLSRKYLFMNYKGCLSFINKVANMGMEEQHHPTITFDHHQVHVMIQSGGNKTLTAVPGLTLQDVAMALNIERLFRVEYIRKMNAYGEDSRPEDYPPRDMRPANMATMMYKMQRIEGLANQGGLSRPISGPPKPYCFICKSKGHSGADCPERARIRPPRPCGFCGGDHWQLDCNSTQFERKSKSPCPICLGLHRGSKCPQRAGPTLHIPRP